MKSTSTGLLLLVFYGLTTAENVRVHVYVSTPMSWDDAHSFCTTYYTDLSTITSLEEQMRLVYAAGGNFSEAWIGLYRGSNNPNIWYWADGQSFNYNVLYLYNDRSLNCAYTTPIRWLNGYCPDEIPFFCYETYNLRLLSHKVNTWENALNYCRHWYTDLASATEAYQLELIQNISENSSTDSVWAGLRFLAGEWHWVSKGFTHIPYHGSLMSCPEEPYRCGAYTKTTAQWEMRDCNEELNFICF